ncbi:MAG: hypothetical protein VXW11_01660 [Pseudomonadota bacterium]|nr:hypothetical protein [Pseudomonadota bacterium]
MEKFGISRNPTLTGPALLLACNRFLILSSLIDISTLKKNEARPVPAIQHDPKKMSRIAKKQTCGRFFASPRRLVQMRAVQSES